MRYLSTYIEEFLIVSQKHLKRPDLEVSIAVLVSNFKLLI